MTHPGRFTCKQMRAKALEAYAAVDLDGPGQLVMRVAKQLRDATHIDGEPQELAVILPYAHWVIGQTQPSKLAVALAGAFTAGQLRGMAAAIAEEGWSDTGTAFEVLRSALVEAGRVV